MSGPLEAKKTNLTFKIKTICQGVICHNFVVVAIGLIVQHIKDILNGNTSSQVDGGKEPGRWQRQLSDSSMISSRPH